MDLELCVPRNWEEELLLDLDKAGKDTDDGRRGEQNDKDPKVELNGRPVVGPHMAGGWSTGQGRPREAGTCPSSRAGEAGRC